MHKKGIVLVSLFVLASMLLGACQQTPAATPETIIQTVIVEGTPQVIEVTATPGPQESEAAGPKVLYTHLGPGDVPTIDPAVAEDNASIQIVEESFVGLTRLDEENIAVIPGLAENWEASDDNLTYTFNLRQDVPWVRYNGSTEAVEQVLDCDGNPRMVNANDFYYGILRTLNPATASPYAYVLSFAVQGAQDFSNGENEDPASVGVSVVDDYTLSITFKEDAAYNLNIAGLWVAYAQPSWLIDGDDCTEARGDRWIEPGFFQSYGPFTLKEWFHDSTIALIKNPFWPGIEGIPQAKLDEIQFSMLDDTAAFAEYEAGNMHVSNVPLADMDRVRTDPTFEPELRIAPQLSSYFYGFNTTAQYVDNVHLRRALSLAVDRQALIDNVTKADQEPAGWFCRPGLVGCPTRETHPDLGVQFDPAKAKEELDAFFTDTGLTLDDINNNITLMFNTGSGHQRIAEAIQAMWQENLGLTVNLTNQEWKVFLETINGADAPQIFRSGWNLDYPDANNFTREVLASGGNYNGVDASGNPTGGLQWYNEQFEALVRQAASEQDPAKRVDLYAQAEQIAVWDDAVVIPLYWYTRVSVTKPEVMRTFSNTGAEHYEKWDLAQ
jgi:oligopeptide transport system substrate-binding protein